MNKDMYRLVWNRSLGALQVVSEMAKSKARGGSVTVSGPGARARGKTAAWPLGLLTLSIACGLGSPLVWAAPIHGQDGGYDSGVGGDGGDGGNGISGSGLDIENDSGISGGNGGGSSSKGGNGGDAISGSGHLVTNSAGNTISGGSGGSGGWGGTGGVGISGSDHLVTNSAGTISGGSGGSGSGIGGDGGDAISGTGQVTNSAGNTIRGGGGGNAGGTGGTGGTGISGSSLDITNAGNISGGNGGHSGGGGGRGGVGISGSGLDIKNEGDISGGSGGDAGGMDGDGGDGITGSGRVINSAGNTIRGGDGAGGGDGISGSGLDITNAGTISGGEGGRDPFNGGNGAAIQFTGGTNSLTLQSGSVVNGAIQLQGSSTASITAEDDSTLGGDIQLNTNALTLDGSSDLTLSGAVSGTTGSLTKNGSGTLALSGNNTYGGDTTLNAGTLIVGSNTALGNGALIAAGGTTLDSSADVTLDNAITLNGNLTLAGNNDLTLNGDTDGAGGMVKNGSGTLTLSGSNTYGGDTTLNAGTLIVGSDTALANGTLIAAGGTTLDSSQDVTLDNAITLNGNLTLAGSNDLTLNGDTDGSGGLVKNGSGDLTLNGNNAYSGGTLLNAGTLTLGSSSALGSGPLTVANGTTLNMNGYNLDIGTLSGSGTVNLSNASLLLDNNVDSIFSGNLTGAVGSGLTKSGINKLVLEGSSNVVSNTRVTAGRLIVGASAGSLASLTSSVEVDSGALLGGHGHVVGDVNVLNGATLAPGNSIGTLTVNGNTTFNSGSILEIETNPDGSSDRLIVNGNLDLGGATLKVLAGAGAWSPSTSYTIVTSSNPIGGIFGNVTSNLAFLTPTLDYSLGTSVALTLARNNVSYAQVAATPNQQSVATVLDGNAGGTLAVAVTGLSAAQARAAYDGLSGELHASARGALFDDSRQMRESITEQLRSGQAGNVLHHDADSGLTFWLKSYGNWSDKDGNRNVADLDRNSRGTLLGLELPLDETWRLGLAAGYGSSDLSIGARDSSADIASTSLAAYLGGQWDALNLRLGVAHTWSEVDSKRQVRIGALRETLKADYDANTTQVFGELGYTLHFGKLTMEPFAGLAHVEVDSDSFRERGGNAALSGKGKRDNADYASLGLHASAPLGKVAGQPLDLRAGLAWQHVFDTPSDSSTLSLSGYDSFSVKGVPVAEDSALLQIALNLQLTPQASLDLGYSGQFGDGNNDNGVRVGLNLAF